MKFTGQFTGAKLDLQAYKKRMDLYLEKKLREVANVWLTAASNRVPVWSGMARGSLLELNELIDGRLLISPRRQVLSRIDRGRALGTAIQNDFIITITTNVPHYTLQEYQNVGVSRTAPWHSLKMGTSAYKNAVKNVRLPKPKILPWPTN